jgi:hypothetical protein
MYDFIIVNLLILPSLILAKKSKSGNYAGYYLLYCWVEISIIGGLYAIAFFIYGVIVFLLVGMLFKRNLKIYEFIKRSK